MVSEKLKDVFHAMGNAGMYADIIEEKDGGEFIFKKFISPKYMIADLSAKVQEVFPGAEIISEYKDQCFLVVDFRI